MKIIIWGISGKMGRMVRDIAKDMGVEVVAGVDINSQSDISAYSAAELSVSADCIIDFSRPEALSSILEYADKQKTPIVLCTTGYSTEQLNKIVDYSARLPIFKSANMSVGINVLSRLLKLAAQSLPDTDVEIIEQHHRQKVDAPSGTALLLADSINSQFTGKRELVCGRSEKDKKRGDEIGLHSIRGGTITGDHSVMFIADEEIITISHSASSRAVFARGAVKAAVYMAGKPAGLYNMDDLLNS